MDQDRVPYVDALREHAARNPARLTVPGPQGWRRSRPGDDARRSAQKALDMDLPALIEGIDVGPFERNPFEQAQRLAAEAWGAARTWFLVGGASQGNHAALPRGAPLGPQHRHAAKRPLERDRRLGPRRPGSHLHRARDRPRAGGGPLPDARRARGGARRRARRGRRAGRLADLLRRVRRRAGARRDLPLARPAADRRRSRGARTSPSRTSCPRPRSPRAPTSSSPRPTRSSAASPSRR